MNNANRSLSRRTALQWAALCASGAAVPNLCAQSAMPIPVADMHTHVGRKTRANLPLDLAEEMRANQILLAAWSYPVDARWIKSKPTGIEQVAEPGPGEVAKGTQRALREMNAYVRDHQLGLVLNRADVDKALAGHPSVVLATEGADFLDSGTASLDEAHANGLRHLQIVHYIRSGIADVQTQAPHLNGLSPFGSEVVAHALRKGMLVDLAHCTEPAVLQALKIAQKPMVWSHGWVHAQSGSFDDRLGWLRRRLSITTAKKIADAGGVVGLWGLGLLHPTRDWEVGRNDPEGYARALRQLVNTLGEDHVAMGTDLNGLGEAGSVNSYSDVRKVVQALQSSGLSEASIAKVSYLNYARVLKDVLPA